MKYPFSWKPSQTLIQQVVSEVKTKSITIQQTQKQVPALELVKVPIPQEIATSLKTGKCVWSITPITGYPTFFQIEAIEDTQLICYIQYEDIGVQNSFKVTFLYGE